SDTDLLIFHKLFTNLMTPSSCSLATVRRNTSWEASMNVVNLLTREQARPKKRKSGIPTGNAGEYFVMGELLRRGYDAQLADRNTAGYDVLVGRHSDLALTKVQIKTVRAQPWYVKQSSFEGTMLEQVTIYVMIGDVTAESMVRY